MPLDWHSRYLQQARWTRDLRSHLFERLSLPHARRVLEVGCGTGAILESLSTPAAIHALDIDLANLQAVQQHASPARLACADALALPYPARSFDITFCHFLLLWVADPLQALKEMERVTQAGGYVLALAEPDYGKRLDRPRALVPLGKWQRQALIRQGADPDLGRRLADLFQQAGLTILETGSLQPDQDHPPTAEEWELEWATLEDDLIGFIPGSKLARMKQIDQKAWNEKIRRLYVPTHFCCGQVP
jgi:SAM-dependent methyltransferase